MAKYNRELFDRTRSAAEILREEREEHAIPNEDDGTCASIFRGQIEGTLGRALNASIIMKWHMLAEHPDNPFGVDVQIPIMTVIEDQIGDTWIAYLTNPTSVHWRFLFLKPHEPYIREYLRGQRTLLDVYKTAAMFFVCTPDEGPELLQIKPSELADELIPGEDSYYHDNIWFDPSDVYGGMNTAPFNQIKQWADSGRYFWY